MEFSGHPILAIRRRARCLTGPCACVQWTTIRRARTVCGRTRQARQHLRSHYGNLTYKRTAQMSCVCACTPVCLHTRIRVHVRVFAPQPTEKQKRIKHKCAHHITTQRTALVPCSTTALHITRLGISISSSGNTAQTDRTSCMPSIYSSY